MHRSNQVLNKLVRQMIATGDWYKQQQIASLLECKNGCLSSWLRGKNEMKQVEVFLKVLDFLPQEVWHPILKEAVKPRSLPNKSDIFTKNKKKKKAKEKPPRGPFGLMS